MISKTYIKLVRYFSVLIITTCLSSMVLFFLTMGAPMTKDFHQLLRNQAKYIGHLTQELIDKDASIEEVNQFLEMTSGYYGIGTVLVTADLNIVDEVDEKTGIKIEITDPMVKTIKNSGIFVQPSHMGKPLIYGLLISSPKNGDHYLFIYKTFSRLKRSLIFGLGLVCLCVLLIFAIYPLSKSFTKPLVQLINAQKQVVEGHFDSTLDGQERDDELGVLLRGFVDMQKSVDGMIESRKELLADISHELRSPLSRLNIDAELIKESSSFSDIKEHADNIDYEIQYMDTLLKQLSDYSTLNLPKFSLVFTRFDPSNFIGDIYRSYQAVIEQKMISFEQQNSEKGFMLNADQAKLTQVFNNLLDNAISVCESQGQICVGGNISGQDVQFFVSNTGKKIPEELRQKIFDPLFRADPSRSRKTGGFGLGLAISKKIVEHHGGKIWCEHENGVTRFVFSLEKESDHGESAHI